MKKYYNEEFKPALLQGKIISTSKVVADLSSTGIKVKPELNINVAVTIDKNKTTLFTGIRPDHLAINSMAWNKSYTHTLPATNQVRLITPTSQGILRKFGVKPQQIIKSMSDQQNLNIPEGMKNLYSHNQV
ncbi:MAG: hypothetical protein IPJ20_19655 [Flammeovirgaceae bacterium]|nr:hypothetical protein [Flammeovirgaceae bacterium]